MEDMECYRWPTSTRPLGGTFQLQLAPHCYNADYIAVERQSAGVGGRGFDSVSPVGRRVACWLG
jgi:hypothetical protein